ncbi:MAG: flagellar protein FliT [Candidatus Nitrotoga sp. SPKER]|nr:MAG: flagellar protein FliT [Candidatus Nitrotoga sp. SPKER]
MNLLIENYELLSSITAQMRVAATDGQWDKLVELEKQCSQHVAIMKAQDIGIPPNESTRLRKVALIRKILEDDAEIRNHTEPWVEQLQHIIHSTGQERRLQQTYFNEY